MREFVGRMLYFGDWCFGGSCVDVKSCKSCLTAALCVGRLMSGIEMDRPTARGGAPIPERENLFLDRDEVKKLLLTLMFGKGITSLLVFKNLHERIYRHTIAIITEKDFRIMQQTL